MKARLMSLGVAAALLAGVAPAAHADNTPRTDVPINRARAPREPNRPRRFGEGRVRKQKKYIGRKHQEGRPGSKLSKKAARGKL